jgi:hypothetical protein
LSKILVVALDHRSRPNLRGQVRGRRLGLVVLATALQPTAAVLEKAVLDLAPVRPPPAALAPRIPPRNRSSPAVHIRV